LIRGKRVGVGAAWTPTGLSRLARQAFLPLLGGGGFFVSVAAGLAIALLTGAPAFAQDRDRAHIVAVWGEGTARAVPDTADVSAGVVSEADTAAAALRANSAAMEKVMQTVQSFGIASGDVQTQGVNVSPVMSRPANSRADAPPQITGYRASNTVSIRVRDMAKLGTVLDTLVGAGANEMHGVRLTVGKPEALLDEARGKAMADAKRKAGLLAQAAGAKLGPVTSISEESAAVPQPRMYARAEMAAVAAVPVSAGEVELKATLRVVYALE
jgi:uncharacterized protein YggE